MRDAGIMAEKAVGDIENKFSKMNPKISTSFFGNLFSNLAQKGIDAAIRAVTDLAARFADLQKAADYAAVSLQWLYGLQAAGAKAGAAFGEINVAVKSLAFQLDEMKRGGDNPLKTLLDANPQFMKGVNRDTMDVTKTLEVVANIISKAKNDVQAFDMAKNLGLPENTVALLQKGGDEIKRMADEAARAAPDLERLAIQSKLLGDAWDEIGKKFKEGAMTGLFVYLNYLASTYRAILEAILPVLDAVNSKSAELARSGVEKIKAAEEKISAAQRGDTTFSSRFDAMGGAPKRVEVTGGTAVDPFARKTGGDQEKAFDRANDQVTKHIALMEADRVAVGLNAFEHERLRTEALLNVAAQKQFGEISEETRLKIEAQANAAGRAAQELAVASDRLSKINAAQQQFGSAISTAFSDAIVEGKKLNEVLDSLVKTLLKAAINSTIMSIFTPAAGGGASPFMSMLKGFAEGTNSAPGGMAMVGERGPELVNLPRGSQVIPNNVTRGMMGGGGAITYAPAIDARGASVEAVARLAQIMEQDRATFASRTVATIQQARRGRVPGL
jgi:hypothetical protein